MIVRLIAIDPSPRPGKSDVLVYQIPEKSREAELLSELLTKAGIEWAIVSAGPRKVKLK